jgi:hypothetical protein
MKIRQTNIHKISELKESEKYSFQKVVEKTLKEGKRVWQQE